MSVETVNRPPYLTGLLVRECYLNNHATISSLFFYRALFRILATSRKASDGVETFAFETSDLDDSVFDTAAFRNSVEVGIGSRDVGKFVKVSMLRGVWMVVTDK